MDMIEIQLEQMNANLQQMLANQARGLQLMELLIEALANDDQEQPQRDMDGNLCLPSESR